MVHLRTTGRACIKLGNCPRRRGGSFGRLAAARASGHCRRTVEWACDWNSKPVRCARITMDSKELARWRGLVPVTPEKFSGCAKRLPKGVWLKFFARSGGSDMFCPRRCFCLSAGFSACGRFKVRWH